jgi:(1->4)-alpha-D-glucan 1-alpha-D-glucosylmutase
VDGTTGYDFLNVLNGIFVDRARERDFRRFYARFTGRETAFHDVVYESKKLIIASSMASELNVLAHELNRMSEEDRLCRDFTLISLQEALREIVACFPIYRTYLKDDGSVANADALDRAVGEALRRNPAMESSIFEFIRSRLFPRHQSAGTKTTTVGASGSRRKFQQYTGPVEAKGLEDTAFYRYCPLASINEVGGEPAAVRVHGGRGFTRATRSG